MKVFENQIAILEKVCAKEPRAEERKNSSKKNEGVALTL